MLALLAEMAPLGGIAGEDAADAGVRVTLLSNGVTILRCAHPPADLAPTTRVLTALGERLESAAATLAGLRTFGDLLTAAAALALAAAAGASGADLLDWLWRLAVTGGSIVALAWLRRGIMVVALRRAVRSLHA